MSINQIFDIAGSGLAAQRLRVQLISSNIANSETTRTKAGGPYRRREAVFQAQEGGFGDTLAAVGVQVAGVRTSNDPFITRYQPGHPDADANGMVQYPNVDPVAEMVDLTEASRSYEANVAVVRAAKGMAASALEILRVQ